MRDIFVIGCGRCGMTATMHMLAAGGAPVLGEYPAYEEIDATGDALVDLAADGSPDGLCVKLVDPKNYLERFKAALAQAGGVVLLERSPIEQARSQIKFLQNIRQVPAGRPTLATLRQIAEKNARDQAELRSLTDRARRLSVCFEILVSRPVSVAESLREFLATPFDVLRAARQIRRRPAKCLLGMLEEQFVRRGAALLD